MIVDQSHPPACVYERAESLAGHINNLYNTTFWALVQQGGMTHTAAEEHLKGTVSGDKNEILWSKFGINYNNEPEMYRKGSVVFREYGLETVAEGSESTTKAKDEDENSASGMQEAVSKTQVEKMHKARRKAKVVTSHVDIIRDEFWIARPWLRSGKPGIPIDDSANSRKNSRS